MVDVDHLEAAMDATPGDAVVMAKADLKALLDDHRRLRGRSRNEAAIGALCAAIVAPAV